MSTFKTAAQIRRHREAHTTAAELLSRAYAASRMAMRGDSYSHDDRLECASHLVTRVLADCPPHSVDVPNETATFTRLFGLASNYRRGIDRKRELETAEALRAPVSFTPHVEMPADETGGTPWSARRSAVDMLRAIGMLGDSEPVHWGPVWTLAYAAARAVSSGTDDEIDRETVAAELEMDRDTLRQHLTRARSRIPAAQTHSRYHWAQALNVPEGGIARKPSRSRSESADMGTRANGPRQHVGRKDHAPVTVKRDRRIVRKSPRGSDWGKALERSPDGRDRRTAARLAAASAIRMDRSSARTDGERDILRLAALAR